MQISEVIFAYGHENILATHKTTLEITKEGQLTRRGNCIVAVSANKVLSDLSPEFRKALLRKNAKITILIEAGEIAEVVSGLGSPKLILTHFTDMVARKSNYICNRTLAIKADKAACDLSKKLVGKLKNPKQKVKITVTVNI